MNLMLKKRLMCCSVISMICLGMMVKNADAKSVVETSGDISQLIIPLSVYASTFIFDDDEGKTEFYESFFLNLGVTYGLKLSVDKTRPDGGSQSFPSGHTSVSFQGATFMYLRYGWKPAIPFYLGAAYVGWSRVDSKRHDTTDVLAGAAIGIASSYLFTKPFKGVTVTPLIKDDAIGLNFSVKW